MGSQYHCVYSIECLAILLLHTTILFYQVDIAHAFNYFGSPRSIFWRSHLKTTTSSGHHDIVSPMMARSTKGERGSGASRRKPTDSKPKMKREHSNKGGPVNRKRQPPSPRPTVTNYQENMAVGVNQRRLCEAINCEHFEQCSGCLVNSNIGDVSIIQSAKQYFSSPWIKQKTIRQPADNQKEFYKVVVPSPLKAWRTQAKLVAENKSKWAKEGCTFGLYKQRTHQVVSIPNCEVHHPSINRAVQVLEKATRRAGTSAFDEDSREGSLRYTQFQVERTTGKICLTLVWNAEGLKQAQPALSRLVKELSRLDPDLWHSIWCNCNDSVGNNILSRNPTRWHRL